MRLTTTSKTGTGSSTWLPLSRDVTPMNVGFACIVTGTVNYTVEHTYDNVIDGSTPDVFSHSTVAAQTTTKEGSYTTPIAAIRVTLASGTGTVTLKVLQAGIA